MISKLYSAAVWGLSAQLIEVEVDFSPGLHSFNIVGLPDKAVEESKERVNSAIKNSSAKPPRRFNQRIVVNLAPADVKKQGPAYDLPIAVGFFITSEQVKNFNQKDKIFIGELSLDGSLRPVQGVLPVALLAKELNKILFLPEENLAEAKLVRDLKIVPIRSLAHFLEYFELENQDYVLGSGVDDTDFAKEDFDFDLSFIKGQEQAKRALEISAAGAHNMLMSGPPGSGKTLLAKTLPSILPSMSEDEIIEVIKIYSIAGLFLNNKHLITQRPFRNPHHSISNIALVGGGSFPMPGEISLAHRGVLFLDEIPEFSRQSLESLRQPMEDGVVSIARANGKITYPARFSLVAAQNPCPCGYFNDEEKRCICGLSQVLRYRKKISGPLLDRIDIHLSVPRIKLNDLRDAKENESSSEVKKRVEKAREKQKERYADLKVFFNSELNSNQIKKFTQVEPDAMETLYKAGERMKFSARAFHKIIKVARTIADLDASEKVLTDHIAEALQYRPKEENDGL